MIESKWIYKRIVNPLEWRGAIGLQIRLNGAGREYEGLTMNDERLMTIKNDEINEKVYDDGAAGGGVCGLQR